LIGSKIAETAHLQVDKLGANIYLHLFTSPAKNEKAFCSIRPDAADGQFMP
jgi:hypothetical protein